MDAFRFSGIGDLTSGETWQQLERLDLSVLDDPALYQVHDAALVQAVNTALLLGMPLLLTGEPGVGKTTLARRLAAELGLGKPLEYRVKSTTEGTDVLYEIDHIRRMTDANIKNEDALSLKPYLRFNALGKAILRTWSSEQLAEHGLVEHVADIESPEQSYPVPTVVLIDEIDKAPSDVPNDLLEELRTLSFTVPNLMAKNTSLGIGGPGGIESNSGDALAQRPIVLITSNSERALPQAFLRRCVYYHMTLPDHPGEKTDADLNKLDDNSRGEYREQEERFQQFRQSIDARVDSLLETIVAKRGEGSVPEPSVIQGIRNQAWDTYHALRKIKLHRKPSTGELLSWLCAVHDPDTRLAPGNSATWRSLALQLLVKQRDDIDDARKALSAADSAP